jgi:type IV pilus assembly protein PilV
MNAFSRDARTRGFSLVEVMVAVVVICIGLLGIAKMQALALSNTSSSRLRSLAAIEATSLAAAMHSNRNFWGAATANYTLTPTAITSAGDAATAALATSQLANPVLCEGAFCQPQDLAAYDLAKWVQSISVLPNAVLPNPQATITYTGVAGVAAPPSFTITITWSENAVSMMKQETGALALPTYTLYVEP